MADYATGRTGGSLRDAVNALMPMTGMGEYNSMYPPSMFPPNAGADGPGSAPVPIPRARPPMPVALPPGGVNLPETYPGAQQLYQGLQPRPAIQPPMPGAEIAQLAGGGNAPRPPMVAGGVSAPIGPNTNVSAGGRFAPGGNYAAMLGMQRRF